MFKASKQNPPSLQMRNLSLLLFSMNITLTSLLFLILFSLPIKLLALTQAEDQFIYNGFNGSNLRLDGSAKVHPNGLLQLTNTSNQQIGHAFYQFPLKFNTSSSSLTRSLSFSTTFVFAIIPNSPKLGGHGMAFTISPSMDFSQAKPIEYLGLFNNNSNGNRSNHLLAVEFDTVQTLDFDDIDGNHVGIDVNSLKSIASAPVTYISKGVNKSLELVSGNAIQVWIDYDEVEKLLNITLAPIKTPKPIRPLLSTAHDLSLVLLDSMYVGFSAATGSLTSNHYILGWSFNRKGQAQELELSKLPSFPRHRKSRENIGLLVTVSLITVSMVLIFIAITWTVYVTRRKRYEELREDWEQEYGPQRFSYKDLHKATNGFRGRELLGEGGFGKVYRGVLPSSSKEIAVKKVSHGSIQGMKEFVSEIASMGRLRHRNLVQLLGYCRRRGELLLVYDYMPNESLDKFLFSNEKPNLDWAQRYRIIKGVASALLYLHEEWEQVVIHRDVKASNVLLDADLNGRLGDFGLARLCDHGANPQTTTVAGTIGFIAPELTRTGQATTFTDVFAFGAFMLEVACGRRPVEPQRLPRERILVDWVFERWKQGAILETIDPRLGGDYAVEEMEFILKLGLLCSHSNPVARPSMRQVMQYLNGDVFPEILLERAEIGMVILGHGATADFVMSTFSLSSNESILIRGR
ncbi:L-type lectin-domain containing receptor kinase SIT2-like [Cornus florida]|uniref:L-type lectin-domain containing receptor kinase SIT2-like n=1 Tax=Cornus florida TaxID=4283 RepID=UPI00289C6A3F|nr:L-type lectin-domain containing receptor kinase SIT2-like [Cornus florida]